MIVTKYGFVIVCTGNAINTPKGFSEGGITFYYYDELIISTEKEYNSVIRKRLPNLQLFYSADVD